LLLFRSSGLLLPVQAAGGVQAAVLLVSGSRIFRLGCWDYTFQQAYIFYNGAKL